MRPVVPDILALLCGMAGWFYLLYSKAATKLSSIESARLNLRRVILRRAGGAVLLLLAAAFFIGSNIDADVRPGAFVLVWIAVMILLAVVVALAMADMRLTARLRQSPQKND